MASLVIEYISIVWRLGFWLGVSIILSWVLYQLLYIKLNKRWKDRARELKGYSKNEELRFVESGGSESSMLTMGSIFIATSFILLIFSNQKDLDSGISFDMASFSAILYALWLYSIQFSTRLIMDAKVEVELMEEHGDDTEHQDNCAQAKGPAHMRRRFYGERNGRGLMMKIRRNHWLFYQTLPTFASMIVITS